MTDYLNLLHSQIQSTNQTLQLISNQIESNISIDVNQNLKDLITLYKLSIVVSGKKTYAIDTLSKIISVLKLSPYCSNNVITLDSIQLAELFKPYNLKSVDVMRIISRNKIKIINHRETKNNKNIKHHYTIFL